MSDKLIIAIKIKKTIEYVDKVLINYPKVEYVLRNNIINTFYILLENVYRSNIYKDTKYMKECIVNIKMIEYYIKISLDKKLLSYKKFENIGKYLLEINKMLNSWIMYEKSR